MADDEVIAIEDVLTLARAVAAGRITNAEAVAAARLLAGPAESPIRIAEPE